MPPSITTGWYCGSSNEGRRRADRRSEYRPGPRRYILLLPAASFADQAIIRAIVLVAIARAGDVGAHRSMNAGQSAEKPFAPKRGETKIALNYHQQRRASVADETSTKRSCAFEGGSTSV
jgi:hypothetical protein